MKPIGEVITNLKEGERILFETPQMKGKYIQGAKILTVDPEKKIIFVRTQDKEVTLGDGTLVSIDVAI
ncbi:MAG: hypothetical protein ACWGHO_02225 [Candidatus Moraniibacteriota bacterium]